MHREFENDIPTHNIHNLTATEKLLKELRNTDRNYQSEYGYDGSLFFGMTRQPYLYIYNAILKGYNPSDAQFKAMESGNGHNFLWDEVTELHSNHPDVSEALRFREATNYAAYVVSQEVILDIFGTMFMRGQEYRKWGWGFPWRSDPIPYEA